MILWHHLKGTLLVKIKNNLKIFFNRVGNIVSLNLSFEIMEFYQVFLLFDDH